MSNGLHNDVLNGKNCLKRSLFDQNFALQGLYFDQNFEKCTLVVGHFILNQIFKNLEIGQVARSPVEFRRAGIFWLESGRGGP